MKQVVQNYRSGELRLADVPAPVCTAGRVLVRTECSLVSVGTERMKVGQARMSLLQKARARPDQVRKVLESARQTGVVETVRKVRERLSTLTPLGYSLSGIVTEVGAGIDELRVGDRVACAGEGLACHAEFVCVPRNLCVPVPAGVAAQDAAFATVGAIALQGVRQARTGLGDSVVVVGLGLVGLLAVQILKAAGCRVIGVDVAPQRLELARQCGAELALVRSDPGLADAVGQLTGGAGADAVYVAASAPNSDPLLLAGELCRDRGRVVIVGMVDVAADWRTYYRKELAVVMSRSYGPGRYDRNYEQKGVDYPIGYVRWTERRNLAEFVRLLGTGQVRPTRLAPTVVPFEDAPRAYDQLDGKSGPAPLAVLFEYPAAAECARSVPLRPALARSDGPARPVGIGFIGAGNFATGTLIPAVRQVADVRLRAICSAGGLSAASAGQRHGFEYCASDPRELLADASIHAVVIATRHDSHAWLAAESLRAGKHVFVEKPLALSAAELDDVVAAQRETGRRLTVGFNRRFSPLSGAVRDWFAGRAGPVEVLCRVNAGPLAPDSWYGDAEDGGWRIVSEGCHFIDLIQFLAGAPAVQVRAELAGGSIPGGQRDNCVVTLRLADGSLGVLAYVANGSLAYEKERIEVFGQQRAAAIENWRAARLVAGSKVQLVKPHGTGKGHAGELADFVAAVRDGRPPALTLAEAVHVTRVTLAIPESIRRGQMIELGPTAESSAAAQGVDALGCPEGASEPADGAELRSA